VLGAAAAAAVLLVGVSAPAAGAATPGRADLPSPLPAWSSDPTYVQDLGAAPADRGLVLRVYLAGKDPVGMVRAARQVSTPGSRAYARYLTPDQFRERFGTDAAQTAAVRSWLTGFGMSVTDANAHYLTVSANVAEVQKAFATSLHAFDWRTDPVGPGVAPVSGISVPRAMSRDISTVIGLDVQPGATAAPAGSATSGDGTPRSARSTQRLDSQSQAAQAQQPGGAAAPQAKSEPPCSQWWGQRSSAIPPVNGQSSAVDAICGYTPQQLRDAYGVTNSPYTGKGRTVAVVLDGALPTMEADADRFFTAHGVPGFAPGQYSENFGPNFAASCHGYADLPEEPLDVESIHITAPDAKVVYVGADCMTGQRGGGTLPFLDAETRIVDQHLADVATDSFSTLEGGSPATVVAAWEQMFQQGALEGIGFNFDSGDGGDGAYPQYGIPAAVTFPASDPWATAVGGTTLQIGQHGEVVGELGWGEDQTKLTPDATGYLTPPPGSFEQGSTGGRSGLYAQPWYQEGIVPQALATAGGTAPAHREVPDIAADGDGATGWLIGFSNGGSYFETTEAGTSGAAPLVAGLEVDAAQARGRALGFANPLLYSLSGTPAIHDVLPAPAGQAPMALEYKRDYSAPSGFSPWLLTLDHDTSLRTTAGYDDVTGIGSPTADFVRSFGRR
jgi:subtilase family serine protease